MFPLKSKDGLVRRGAVYHFYRRIPDNLIHHYDGKRHLRFSLKTKDIHEARRLRNLEAVKADRQFQELAATGKTPSSMLASELNQLWQSDQITYCHNTGVPEASNYEAAMFALEDLAESGKLSEETVKEAYRQHSNHVEGVYTLEDLINEHRREHTSKLAKAASQEEYEFTYELLTSILSPHTPLSDINREKARKVRSILESLPPNWRKFKALKGKSPAAAADTAKALNLRLAKPLTVSKRLTFINALFNYAALEEHMPKNPFSRLTVKDPEAAKDKRSSFTGDELKVLFKHLPGDGMDYWMALIALHQGMRMGEILQLKVRDVAEIGGVLAFRIHEEDEGNTVKTSASIRKVPVHQRLLDLGILELIEGKPQEALLFPEAKRGSGGKLSNWYSKEFTKILKKAGLHASHKKTFHSLRHTFRDACRDACRDAEIPTEVANMLGGWSNQGVSASYGSGASMGTLKKALNCVKYRL